MTGIPQLPTRRIADLEVSRIGLGCMPASWSTDPATHDSGIAAIQAALDAGITLLDTADIYAPTWNSMGHNERIVAEAVRTWVAPAEAKARVVIATKGGITRGPGESWGRNGGQDYLFRAVEASACRLGVDHIDIWQHHRMDPSIPFETQFEHVMALREHGIVRRIGLSNVDAEMLRRAIAIGGSPLDGGVVSVQNEFSPRYRQWSDVMELCAAHGIAFLPWSPLGGGSFASELPTRYATITAIAAERGASPYVVTLAWHLRLAPVVIPIPGASKATSATDSARAATFELTDEEFARIQDSLPESAPLDDELSPAPPYRD